MNLLIIIDRRYPCDHAFLETIYSKLFPKRGHKIYWIMRSNNITKKVLVKKWNKSIVIVIPTFSSKKFYFRIVQNILVLKMVFTIFKTRNIDFVQVRNWVWAGFVALFVNKKCVFQYSFPSHLIWEEKAKNAKIITEIRIKLYLFFWRYVLNNSDRVFVISGKMKNQLSQMGFNNEKLIPFGLGFDSDISPDEIESVWIKNKYQLQNKLKLIYFGSMDPERNLTFLVNVIGTVVKEMPDIILFMLGGSAKHILQLKEYIAKQGLSEYFIFTGRIPRNQVYEYLNISTLSLSPIPPGPLYDVSSVTKVYESLGMGIPVVGNKLPDQKRIIEESGGGICVDYDINIFSKAIVSLLRAPIELTKMGKRSMEYIREKHSYKLMAKDIEKEYLLIK